MKTKKLHRIQNDNGFIMVWSLLLLVVVTLLGAAGIATSIFEEKMAANEALHNQTFYLADGGSENAIALAYENFYCSDSGGFQHLVDNVTLTGDIKIVEGHENFWMNVSAGEIAMASPSNNDFYYPSSSGPEDPRTDVRISGYTNKMIGAAQMMLAGYEFLGKTGTSGNFLEFDIKVAHSGRRNSLTDIHTKIRDDGKPPVLNCVY